jgi:hypothetical protein
MTAPVQQPEHPQRCDTCQHYQPYEQWGGDCKILNHWLKTGEYELIKQVGCASHSNARPHPPAPITPFPNSTQLIEMAHTEWKNREERRGIHQEDDFCAGWITGYLTRQEQVARTATLAAYDRVEKEISLIRCQEEDIWYIEACKKKSEQLRQQEPHP